MRKLGEPCGILNRVAHAGRSRLRFLAVLAVAMAILLPTLLVTDYSSADNDTVFTIDLVDPNGDVITTPLFPDAVISFSTETTPEGVRYILENGCPIDSIPAYFVVRADKSMDHDIFRISVKLDRLVGDQWVSLTGTWMDYYGIRVTTDDGGTADLRASNADPYEAVFKDAQGRDNPYEFNKWYGISFAALDGSQSNLQLGELKNIRVTLEAELNPECHNVIFTSQDDRGRPYEVERRPLYETDRLGTLPDPDDGDRNVQEDEFLGWFDSNHNKVTEDTLVSDLPSYDITGEWTWPKIEHWTDPPVVNPDGSVTVVEHTRITYRDQSFIEQRVSTTTYPDGKSKVEESSTTYDPDMGIEETSNSTTDITVHEDGSETWVVTETETDNIAGTSQRTESVKEFDKYGLMITEDKKVWITDPDQETREYKVVAKLVNEREEKYRVEATLPDTTILDVSNAKEIIDEYDYTIAVVGTYSEIGLVIVPDDTLQEIANHGYYLSVSNDEQYVALDSDVVRSLAEEGGEVRLQVKKATEDEMTPSQKDAVGNNYAFSVELTLNGKVIDKLDGQAEVSVTPGLSAVSVFYVGKDGTMELVPCSYDPISGKVTFMVDHFSIFMIEEESEDNSFAWPWVIFVVAEFILITAVAIIWYRRRRKKETI